jgi:uncharacterized protein involved in exopolysaccharide biosynthesis/Mrp family chromosome partitioning ATPase
MGLPGGQNGPIQRMPAAHPDQVFFHFDFLRSLQMHRRLAVGVFLIALLLSAGYTARRWSTYKAKSLAYVKPSPSRMLESGTAQQWPYDANTYESYIQEQIHNVTRPDVLAAAVKKMPGWRGTDESEQAAADRLGSNIEATRVGAGYKISIVATAGSAEEAADMANAVANSYIESATRELRAGDPQRIELLREERDRIVKELASDRTEQEDLSKKLGVAAVGAATPDPFDDQIAQVRAELVKARTANDEAAAKLTAMARGTSTVALDAQADELVSADPGMGSLKTALNKRRSDLISQMANLTPNHPQYKQDADELAKINSSLETMTRELRSKAGVQLEQRLKNDLETTSSVESRLNGQLAQLTGAAGSATPRLQRSAELATDVQRLQNRFTVVDEQFRNLTMENNAPGAVYLSAAAMPPLTAARSKVLRNAFIVVLAGLVFAIGGALVAHNLDPRVYIACDVERVLGFAPMALLPDLYEVGSGVADEYMLRLAAAVEHAHQQGTLNSCIFTGVAPGAGVTTVSTRVSSMLEAMGRETVLVDAVGAPPPRAEGTPRPGTGMVHAPRGTRSTALLQQMTQEAGDDTIVVTDSAPLLVSGETEYLARFVDSAIVVIESGITTKVQLREVARTLQRLEVSSVGFVLNRIVLDKANPGFRQSVRAVEKHLRAQARGFDHSTLKTENPLEREPETPRKPSSLDRLWNRVSEPVDDDPDFLRKGIKHPIEESAGAETARVDTATPRQPANTPYVRAVADPSAETVIAAPGKSPQPAAQFQSEPAYAPAAQSSAAPVAESAVQSTPAPVTGPVDESPLPEILRKRSEVASAAAAQPERSEARLPGFVSRPMRGREPVRPVASQADARPAFSPPDLAAAAEFLHNFAPPAPQPGSAPQPARETPAGLSDRLEDFFKVPSAEPLPERRSDSVSQPVREFPAPPAFSAPRASELETTLAPESPAFASEADPEELPYSAASRLGGLRNLLTTLGIKNLHMEAEFRKIHPESEAPRVERLPERAVFAQPDTPAGFVEEPNAPAPAVVVARPEIIPPRLNVEPAEREQDMARPVKSPQVNRWDSPEDVDTLPSRRGQYRKRH